MDDVPFLWGMVKVRLDHITFYSCILKQPFGTMSAGMMVDEITYKMGHHALLSIKHGNHTSTFVWTKKNEFIHHSDSVD